MREIKYKCPICGAVAEIDKKGKTVTVEIKSVTIKQPRMGQLNRVSSYAFPSHFDCEFNKSVDEIDLDKLEQVDQPFIYETVRGVPV